MVHASAVSGISELMKIAHFAEIYGITIAPHNPSGPVALAAAAMQNFNILEHCPIQPRFDGIQTTAVPMVEGHVDVDALAERPVRRQGDLSPGLLQSGHVRGDGGLPVGTAPGWPSPPPVAWT